MELRVLSFGAPMEPRRELLSSKMSTQGSTALHLIFSPTSMAHFSSRPTTSLALNHGAATAQLKAHFESLTYVCPVRCHKVSSKWEESYCSPPTTDFTEESRGRLCYRVRLQTLT